MLEEWDKTLSHISVPSTEDECIREGRNFAQFSKVPIDCIIYALDGIAIEIAEPRKCDTSDLRRRFSRKKFFAICVQAVVEADYSFEFMSASHTGSNHELTAFQATRI